MNQPLFFKLPTVTRTRQGSPRQVGFELEFTGLDLEQTTRVVETVLGGTRVRESAAACVVDVPDSGEFTVELDWDFLKKKAAQQESDGTGDWIDLLSQAATWLVPMEVVCPPIDMTALDRLDPLIRALRDAGAKGTKDSMIAAYGVHINAEIPSLDAQVVLAYLHAFSLLQWWLVDAHQVDMARRISPYVDLYPEAYLQVLFSCDKPDFTQIAADYLIYNASRNRALDMLPLLSCVHADRVQNAVTDPKIKPRPAFHYRLPNCQIDHPDWSLARPWNLWWVVEELAQRPEDLTLLKERFLSLHRPLIGVNRSEWTAWMDRWIIDHVSA
ncbi:MAG: amidoligase family protein [Desulfotignum sp.]|nr:amidoligase family protein [Desulfotignum sp.]MCF8138041.1 amidoligase family protein [Desulfotignum sp.]